MKIFKKMKDGGKESTVTGYWLIEAKRLFSVVLLKFEGRSREAYHSHAFNAYSWVLKGRLREYRLLSWGTVAVDELYVYKSSLMPVYTSRNNMHQVHSDGTTWVLSFRGPWAKSWKEFLPVSNRFVTLTNGRVAVN